MSNPLDRDSSIGKAIIIEHFIGEMRRRNLDPTLLTFQWIDDGKRPPALRAFRGSKQDQVMFSRADVEDLATKPGLYGKYSARVLKAINKLLQEG